MSHGVLCSTSRVMLQTWRPISQSLPAANIVSKECWIDRLAVLVLDFTVLPVSLPIFEPGRAGLAFHTWQHTHSLVPLYGSVFFSTKPFHYYLMFLIIFYVDRLNGLICPWPYWCRLQTSSFKTQHVERKAKIVLNTNKKVLPSRWVSWGDKRPTFKRRIECENSSSFFQSFQFHRHTCNPQETQGTQTCAVLLIVQLNQCKDFFKLPRTCVISKTSQWKLNE